MERDVGLREDEEACETTPFKPVQHRPADRMHAAPTRRLVETAGQELAIDQTIGGDVVKVCQAGVDRSLRTRPFLFRSGIVPGAVRPAATKLASCEITSRLLDCEALQEGKHRIGDSVIVVEIVATGVDAVPPPNRRLNCESRRYEWSARSPWASMP